jgi:hypothetical protein
MLYYRICNGLMDYGQYVPENSNIYDIVKLSSDWYSSIYLYSEEQVNTAKETITKDDKERPRGIAGVTDVITKRLVWDFDSETDIELAKTDTIKVVDRLINEYDIPHDSIYVFFSGSKGFSVELWTNDELSPEQFKKITAYVADGCKTFDTKVSNPSRIFRTPFTKHNKTGLYKTPLQHDELNLDVESIKSLCCEELEPFTNYNRVNLTTTITDILKIKKSKFTKVDQKEIKSIDFDLTSKPKYLSNWKYALLKGYYPNGCRSYALMILAATHKNLGYPKEVTYRILKGSAELQAEKTGGEPFSKEDIWRTIINQVYSENWKGGDYSEDNFPLELKEFFIKMNIPQDSHGKKFFKPIKVYDIRHDFHNYIDNIEDNRIYTGLPSLDKRLMLTTGMNLGIIGAAGAGKTSLALNILEHTSKNNVLSVFASIDMHRTRVYEKMIYFATGKTRQDLFDSYGEQREKIDKKINSKFKNVWFFDRSATKVQDLRNYIDEVEQSTGEKVKLLVIDYFERILGEIADQNVSAIKIGNELQDLLNDYNLCIVTFVQPRKDALHAGPDSPILNYTSIKGSSFLYQSFRAIMSLWRPFYTAKYAEYDNYMQMAILKNDLGMLKQLDYGWAGSRGLIRELEDIERQELKELLNQKDSDDREEDDKKFKW